MALSEAFDKLKEAVGDLSSLDVLSFTGELSAIVSETEGNLIDWDKLIAKAKTEGDVSLVLATHFKFDGDATLFTARGDISSDIRAAHAQAIQAGQQVRRDLFEFFSDTVKNLL
jgi:hypothetical protein